MRPRPLLALTCLAPALAAGGCGGGDDPRAARAPARVELAVSVPADTAVVRAEEISVQGTVAPARAEVRVLGRAAEVTAGRFTAAVPLEPGTNVIDVIATARGREPAMTALRVTREVPVTVPDLAGLDADAAREELRDVGLRADIEEHGSWLEDLLPEEPTVCVQDPEPGTQVRRDTTVSVVVSKTC